MATEKTWRPLGANPAFNTAEKAYTDGEYILALWDHAQCRGWNLYAVETNSKRKWVGSLGAETVGMTAGFAAAILIGESAVGNLGELDPDRFVNSYGLTRTFSAAYAQAFDAEQERQRGSDSPGGLWDCHCAVCESWGYDPRGLLMTAAREWLFGD